MNKELGQEIKNYNFLDKLRVGYFIDAMDEGRWKVGKIVEFKSLGHRHTVTIRFDGHTSRWNEDYDLPSSHKLAPFRRYSLPYTGPWLSGREIFRDLPNMDFEEPLRQLNKINNMEKMKADFVNQVYRGQLFILVDNILTRKATLSKEEFINCLALFQAYLETGTKILKFSLEHFAELSSLNINDPNAIYVSTPHALIASLPEFLFNFNSLINGTEMRIRFHAVNQMHKGAQELRKEFIKWMVDNKVGEMCKKILEFQNPPHRGFPWSIKKQALILLSNFDDKLQFPKISDVREITDLMDYLSYLSLKSVFSPAVIEQKQVQLIITLITCGNFEGKLKGLNEMKKIMEDIKPKPKTLKQQIMKTNLLEMLTDNSSFNGQLFKRSLPIFEYAEKNDLLTAEILARVLNLHKDKHQLELKSFYGTLAEFGKFLNEKKVITFFDELKKFPIEEHWVSLIKDYTLAAADYHPVYRKKYADASTGLGVVCLWEVIESKDKLPEQLMDRVVIAFSEMLVNIFYKKDTEKYVSQAIYGIKDRRNMDSYFKIIHYSLKKNRDFALIIQKIDQDINIVETVVNSVISSKMLSTKAVQNMFEFLEEINLHAKRKLTVEHIKVLWNLPGCRTSLLKFMRKYRPGRVQQEKSTDKILSKQLSNPEIKEIIEKIFLNPELMDHYSSISDETFQTADELLVCFNHNAKTIEYNYKHTIRCEKPEEIFGLAFYMNAIVNCKDQVMVDKCLKRFIEFFIRPQGKSFRQADKLTAWAVCVRHLSRLKGQNYRAYELFFEEIAGRKQSLTILETMNRKLVVMLKTTKEKKTINLPTNSSLWMLRETINDAFNLKNTNFEMFYPERNNAFGMDQEEDFSLVYIDIPKDSGQPAVIITPTNEPHPHFVTIEEFKKNFSAEYAESLYESINKQSEENQKIILNVLLKVPPLKSLEKKMTKLDQSVSWDEMLDVESRVKLAYQLWLIRKVKSEGMSWAMTFIKRKGIEHMQKIFMTRNRGECCSFDYEVLTELVGLFNEMIKFYKTHSPTLPFSEQFLLELIRLPKNIKLLDNIDYFYSSFGVLREMAAYEHIRLKQIFENRVMMELLETLLFTNCNSPAAERFPETLIFTCTKGKCMDILRMNMEKFVNFNWLVKQRSSCRIFFNLLVILLEKDLAKEGVLDKTCELITNMRESNDILETDENRCDQLIFGWLKVVECLSGKNKKGQNIKIFHEPESEFAVYLINQGLFNKIHRLQSQESRLMAYKILSNLRCEQEILDMIGGITSPMMRKGSWRKQYEWYVRSFQKRGPQSNVGIKNLAATCYINSLLQQLFYIPQFSIPLLSVNTKEIEDEENIAYEIQKIFAHLKYSDNDVYTTESLCRTFILDGQPIDPRIQTDVDEFFHSLMDKLERNFMKINRKEIIDNVFRGQYSNLIIGQECPHKSERIEHFLSMRLQILNKKSLHQALEEFIKGQILEGDNAYFCEKCDKKVKALKRVCVKTLPDMLILTLKRFEFDFDKMEKFKLNSYCEFPQMLDMFPFVREALENEQKQTSAKYQYRLKGIVIHYGISEAGHYTSYVRTEGDQWKYFDDDRIYPFDFKDLGRQCFGGVEDNLYSEDKEKLKNAYLLIYEKMTIQQPKKDKVDKLAKAEVEEQNERNQEVKVLFEDGLRVFMSNNFMKMGKDYLNYVHLVLLRSEKRNQNLKNAYYNCIQVFENTPNMADWYLNQFSESFIKEFLIYGVYDASYFVASLAVYCVKITVNIEFIRRCMKCLEGKNMVPMSKIFQAAVAANIQYMRSLAEFSFSEKILKIIKEQKAPNIGKAAEIPNVRSEFGDAVAKYNDRKDYRDSVELLEAIEGFKVNLTIQDISFFSLRAKKTCTQLSLAKIISQRYKDDENFQKLRESFLVPRLVKDEYKLEQEYCFNFVIILVGKLAEIKDEYAPKRIKSLSLLYIDAIINSLEGYKALRYLLEGLFNICFTNPAFWHEFISYFSAMKEFKKIVKAIRDWIKDSDKFYFHVKNEKMGYWRKPDRKYYVSKACLEQIEEDENIRPERYLNLFNVLIEKQNISFDDIWNPEVKVGERVVLRYIHNQLSDFEQTVVEIVGKAGLLVEYGENRFVGEGDVTVLRTL